MKRYIPVVLAGVLLGMILSAKVADSETPPGTAVVTGCVIRFTSAGPVIHENASHANTGCDTVAVEADGDLAITQKIGGAVVTVFAEEDESLIRKDVNAGPSGGAGKLIVRFAKAGAFVRADSDLLICDYCNLWVGFVQVAR